MMAKSDKKMVGRCFFFGRIPMCLGLVFLIAWGGAEEDRGLALHRLRYGKDFVITVDPSKRRHLTTKAIAGQACHKLAGWSGVPYHPKGEYTLNASLEKAVRDLQIPICRFYALGAEEFSLTEAIDKAAQFCERTGISQNGTVLEFEAQNAKTKLAPEVWAAGVKHSLDQGYQFHHWEITNEPWDKGAMKPEEYLTHFVSVSKAIREVDPQAQIGISIWRAVPYWGNEMLLEKAAGHYDFVSSHYYDFTNPYKNKFEDVVLTGNFLNLRHIQLNEHLIRRFNPEREVYQYDTEWGLHGAGPNGEHPALARRNASLYGTVYRGVRMIYYARDGMLRGACGWELFVPINQSFGVLSPSVPEKQSMLYWLYYYFGRHLGDHVLVMDGTAPYYKGYVGEYYKNEHIKEFSGPLTPTILTTNEEGTKIFGIIANGSWDKVVPLTLHVQGGTPSKVNSVLLSHDNPDADPFLEKKEDFVKTLAAEVNGSVVKCEIPPHSLVFLEIDMASPPQE